MSKVKRLCVISIDAMISEDFEYMKTLPNIGPYVTEASRIVNVRSIYPSLTLPCHTTMVTGVYPDRHHVIHNEEFFPGVANPPWMWYRDRFADCDTVLELAKKNGYSVGCAYWPTCGNIDVDWNVCRTWDYMRDSKKDFDATATGSTLDFLEELWPAVWPTLSNITKAEYDTVYNIGLCEMIRRKKPEVVFQHVSYLDYIRHKKGVYAPEVYTDGWAHHDRLFGDVLDALRDIGELENTTIILTSDHGQTPVSLLLSPNLLLIRDGLIRVDENGKLLDWDAFFYSCGHSCHVYIKDPGDKTLEKKIYHLLKQYHETGELASDRILSKAEAESEYRLAGDFSFVVEGLYETAYNNALTGQMRTLADNTDYKYSVATHGHMPEKGPQPTFFLCGANSKKGVIIENADLVDEAPTIAALLGFEMPGIDGHVLNDLIL